MVPVASALAAPLPTPSPKNASLTLIWGDHDPLYPLAQAEAALGFAPNARLHRIPARRSFDPRAALSIAEVLKRERIQVLQTWLRRMDIWGGVASGLAGVPWLFSERSQSITLHEAPYSVSLIQELSEFNRLNNALAQSEQRFRLFFENAPLALVVSDAATGEGRRPASPAARQCLTAGYLTACWRA